MMARANRLLALFAACLLAICIVYLAGGADALPLDLRPGSPLGQSAGIAAGLVLLATFYYLPLRRSDDGGPSKATAQHWHALAGTLGCALAVLHSQAALREWSTLVLLAILGLLASGLYGRIVAPLRVGSAFGRGAVPYANAALAGPAAEQIARLVQAKREALKALDADAREGQFALRWRHWSRQPRAALAYYRLVIAERRLLARNPLAAQARIPLLERSWRRLHLWLAMLFVIGLAAHVVTTVFFAGYVADGREIYWWHLTAW